MSLQIKPVDLSIIIINYNGAAFIKDCIDSVFASKTTYTYDVWLVDNDSKDNSLDVLKPYKDRIHIIANKDNLGFPEANNQAIKECKGTSVFLLNNDTIIKEDTIQKLMDFHKDNPNAALSPKLLNADGTLQAPGSSLGSWRFKATKPTKVPFIAGAAVVMTQKAYWDIGGLDENLFFYNDDIDMCKMLKKCGYDIIYFPTAELTHFGGLSTKFRKLGSLIEGYRGGLYISYKHYGPILHALYRVVLLVDIIPRILIHSLLGIIRSKDREYVKAYLKVALIDFTNDIYVKGAKYTTK